MPEPRVHCRGLSAGYGGADAIHDVDLDVETGSVCMLVGPNGSGKSTLLFALLGMIGNARGEISIFGRDPRYQRSKVLEDVTFVADVASLPRTIRLNRLAEMVNRLHPAFNMPLFHELLGLARVPKNAYPRTLSKGQLAQAHLALVMAIDARLLVLDEPTLGMDIEARRRFRDTLVEKYLNGQRSLLVTTHYPNELASLITHVAFIESGRIVFSGRKDDMQEEYRIVRCQADKLTEARAHLPAPLEESPLPEGSFDLLFQGADAESLNAYGEQRPASVEDVYLSVTRRQDRVRTEAVG